MARYKRAPAVNFPTDVVFAAAAAAYRINGNQYVNALPSYDMPEMTFKDGKVPLYLNKTLMLNHAVNQSTITDEDRQLGGFCRVHCQALALKVLKEQALSEFDAKILALATADSITDRDFGLIACTPKLYMATQKRREIDDKMFDCKNEYVGKVGEKMSMTINVVKCIFSQKFQCHVVTATDDQNRALFFFRGPALEVGKSYKIGATIKRHADKFQTQLSYVRVAKTA